MKIQPEAHNAISIILDNGDTYEIRDVQDSQGYHFEIHGNKNFSVSRLDLKTTNWLNVFDDKWIRIA